MRVIYCYESYLKETSESFFNEIVLRAWNVFSVAGGHNGQMSDSAQDIWK